MNKYKDEPSCCVEYLNLQFYNMVWNISTCLEILDGILIFNWLNLYSVSKWSEKKPYDCAASDFGETFKRIMETT